MPEQDMSERLYIPAQVRAVGDAARIATLTELLRNGRALDASVLDEHPPFFWRALISNTRVDSHFTHMLLSSLRNYAREAVEGIAFLPGHDRNHLPIGGSLTGELSEEGSEANLRADFFTLTGLEIGSINTSSLVAGIRGGLTRDVSVGIFGGKWLCDICGQNYFDYRRCSHFAGFTYEEEESGIVRQILCTVGVDDAHLSEVSGVFDGSTPGAMIEKVYEAARGGALTTDDVRHAETVYRLDKATTERMLALPALQKRHAGVDTRANGQKPREDERMSEEQTKMVMTEKEFQRLVDNLCIFRMMPEDERATVTPETAVAYVELAGKRMRELEPRAADGDAYRNDLVSEALAEGVRAYGENFDAETYEEQLRSAPLKVVKRMRDDWQGIGNARFPGGRQTTDGDEQPAQAEPVSHVPDRAYAA